jgi:hypothetical protein
MSILTCAPSWLAILSSTLLCQLSPVRCSSRSLRVAGTLGIASSTGVTSLVLRCSECKFVRLLRRCSPLPAASCGMLFMDVKASLCMANTSGDQHDVHKCEFAF